MKLLPLLALLPLLSPADLSTGSGGGDPFIEKYLSTAERHMAEGNTAAARAAVERALERDDKHLGALKSLAELALEQGDPDTAAWAYHRWLQVVESAEKLPVSRSERKAVLEAVIAVDERAEDFRDLTDDHLKELHKLAKAHAKRGRLHSALEVYAEILLIDIFNAEARAAVKNIRRTGGEDVAVEDAFAGAGDPTEGLDPEWLAEEDAKHSEWENAWTKQTENYKYRTNAGFLVLQTSSIAMEQMNRAYRKFFRFKEDGGATPMIEVRVFKSRDEYLKYNNLPENDWTGGFFNGSTVQTFLGGPSGTETIRQMYGTLFHEAAHQFVSLTGRGGVPGWLNEAYASFFEGTTILSNGSVRWNQVATHRLFPLARRMEQGWMTGPSDGVRDESGEWATPTTAPTLRILVENQYQWGPPWYAPTWGVVYFLYNLRDEDGRLIYRESLNDYYYSGARSVGRDQRVEHFENIVIKSAPLSPVENIEGLNELWRDWILELRDIQLGKKAARKSNYDYGLAALARGETDAAVDFLEEAFLHTPEDPEVLWKLAGALENTDSEDRAAAMYLQFTRELELRGQTDDERYPVAKEKLTELDPLFSAHAKLKRKMLEEGLELAKSYRDRGFPMMALEIARRMSAQFSLPEALDFYIEVASETGRSLARWKVAYNELDLEGWSGSEFYNAYGAMLVGDIKDDGATGRPADEIFTADLTYDAAFDGDYSLEAQLRFDEGATIAGLTFGRKDANTTHAVILHPAGYLDISTKDGGTWTYRDHRSVSLPGEWQKLRIDLVDKTLDVYLNDRYIRSIEMPSRDSVQGGFGLITGTGKISYRNLRFLARDPYDPAARIERELALAKIASSEIERPEGTFTGFTPPPFVEDLKWIQGEPLTLDHMKGAPSAIVFWSKAQEDAIPTGAYYQHLAQTYAEYDMKWVVVIGGEHKPAQIRAMLQQFPMPDVHVAHDSTFEFYKSAHVVPGGWGLPRILVLDVDGKVTWEGDPGLIPGRGWKSGDGETYLDGPIKEIIEKRQLKEIRKFAPELPKATKLARAGLLAQAWTTIRPLAELKADFSPIVQQARDLRDFLEGAGAQLLAEAEVQAADDYPMRAAALLEKVSTDFIGTSTGDLAAGRLATMLKDSDYRAVKRAWRSMDKAYKSAERDKPAAEIIPDLDAALAECELAEIAVLRESLRAALFRDGSEGFLEAWRQLSPEGYLQLRLEALASELAD